MAWPDLAWPYPMQKAHTRKNYFLYFVVNLHLNNICDYLFILTCGLRLIQLKKKKMRRKTQLDLRSHQTKHSYIRCWNYCHHHVVKCAHVSICVMGMSVWCSCKARSSVNRIIIYTFAQTHMLLLANIQIAVKSNRIQTYILIFLWLQFDECK